MSPSFVFAWQFLQAEASIAQRKKRSRLNFHEDVILMRSTWDCERDGIFRVLRGGQLKGF